MASTTGSLCFRPSLHCVQVEIAWYFQATSDSPTSRVISPGLHYLKDKIPSLCLSEKHNTSDTIRSVGKRRRGSSSSCSWQPGRLLIPFSWSPSPRRGGAILFLRAPDHPLSPPFSSMAAYNCMCLPSPAALAPTQRGPSGDVAGRLVCRLGARMGGGNLCAVCCPPLTLIGSHLASQKYPVVDEARGGPAWCHILLEALPARQTTSTWPEPLQLQVPGGPPGLKTHSPQSAWCAD